MIDTTGWAGDGDYWVLQLHGQRWCCRKNYRTNMFELSHVGHYTLATRPTLRECQILAHDTARLWAGGVE